MLDVDHYRNQFMFHVKHAKSGSGKNSLSIKL